MGFIGFLLGAVLVAQAFSIAGIGAAILALVLWVLFGSMLGLPPLIGLLFTLGLWKPQEALAGLVVQSLLFVGALWIFEAVGLGDVRVLFAVFCGINGFLMAPAMVKERHDQINAQRN